jgi:trehalose synthase
MQDVMDFWLQLGVDGFRLLTVPYLFERRDTSSKDLDETHAYLRGLRSWMDAHYEGRALIAWSDSWPRDAASYFGADGAPEAQLVMYAPLMPSLLLAILHEVHGPVSDVLAEMDTTGPGVRWAVFLRNGDEMPLGLLRPDQRTELLNQYAALPRMRWGAGIRRRTAPLLANDRRQLELAFALLLSMPGAPIVYYGDEIAMGENLSLPGTHSVKTPMQWSPDRNGGFTDAEPENMPSPVIQHSVYGYLAVNVENQRRSRSSLVNLVKTLIDARRGTAALTGASCTLLRSTNPAVLAYLRGDGPEQVVCLFNFSRYPQPSRIDLGGFEGAVPVELIGAAPFPAVPADGAYTVFLGGHGVLWFRLTGPAGADG